MKRFIATLCVMAMLFQVLPAADLYLKNGMIVKNVQLVGVREKFGQQHMFMLFNGKETSVLHATIERIDNTPYDSTAISQMVRPGDLLRDAMMDPPPAKVAQTRQDDSLRQLFNRLSESYAPPKKEYRNLAWLSVSVLSIGLAWDFMERAQAYEKLVNGYSQTVTVNGISSTTKISPDDSYKSDQSRMNILTLISLGAGVAATIHALTPVEVKVGPNSVSMNVPF